MQMAFLRALSGSQMWRGPAYRWPIRAFALPSRHDSGMIRGIFRAGRARGPCTVPRRVSSRQRVPPRRRPSRRRPSVGHLRTLIGCPASAHSKVFELRSGAVPLGRLPRR